MLKSANGINIFLLFSDRFMKLIIDLQRNPWNYVPFCDVLGRYGGMCNCEESTIERNRNVPDPKSLVKFIVLVTKDNKL